MSSKSPFIVCRKDALGPFPNDTNSKSIICALFGILLESTLVVGHKEEKGERGREKGGEGEEKRKKVTCNLSTSANHQ